MEEERTSIKVVGDCNGYGYDDDSQWGFNRPDYQEAVRPLVRAVTKLGNDADGEPVCPGETIDLSDVLAEAAGWGTVEAGLCREAGRSYTDAEPCELVLRNHTNYSKISSTTRDDDAARDLKEEQREKLEEVMRVKREELRGVLGRVHVWRRPEQVLEYPVFFGIGNNLLTHKPMKIQTEKNTRKNAALVEVKEEPYSIPSLIRFKEGSIFNDSHFLTAVAMLSTRKDLFQRLFANLEGVGIGMFSFLFYSLEDAAKSNESFAPVGWKVVNIDSLLPVDARYKPVFGEMEDPNELWFMMLEKAYAKFLGSYSHLHYGDAALCFINLTGGDATIEEWDPTSIEESSTAILWWKIREALSQRSTLALCMCETEEHLDSKIKTTESIRDKPDRPYHQWNETAIVVLDVAEITIRNFSGPDKVDRLVKTRTLFGSTEWEGDYHNDGRAWSKDARDVCGYPPEAEDPCIMWVLMGDLTKHYNTMLVGSGPDGSRVGFYDSVAPQGEGTNPYHATQYLIKVTDPEAAAKAEEEEEEENGSPLAGSRGQVVPYSNRNREKGNPIFMDSDDEAMDPDSDEEGGQPRRGENTEQKMEYVNLDVAAFEAERRKQLASQGDDETKGPQLHLKLTISQPQRTSPDGHIDLEGQAVNLRLFKVAGEHLQACSYGQDDTDDSEEGKVFYSFPNNNRIKLISETGDKFKDRYRVALRPGFYSLAVFPESHSTVVHYNLGIEFQDDPTFPTGYNSEVSQLGSCADPRVGVVQPLVQKNPRKVLASMIQRRDSGEEEEGQTAATAHLLSPNSSSANEAPPNQVLLSAGSARFDDSNHSITIIPNQIRPDSGDRRRGSEKEVREPLKALSRDEVVPWNTLVGKKAPPNDILNKVPA